MSTALAVLKCIEFWRDRFQMEVTSSFTNVPEIGNTVFIRNLSSRPFIMTGWELMHGKGRWPLRRFESFDSADYDDDDRTIGPHSTRKLTFADARYFTWNPKALGKRRIFFRIFIAGRRPQTHLLHRN